MNTIATSPPALSKGAEARPRAAEGPAPETAPGTGFAALLDRSMAAPPSDANPTQDAAAEPNENDTAQEDKPHASASERTRPRAGAKAQGTAAHKSEGRYELPSQASANAVVVSAKTAASVELAAEGDSSAEPKAARKPDMPADPSALAANSPAAAIVLPTQPAGAGSDAIASDPLQSKARATRARVEADPPVGADGKNERKALQSAEIAAHRIAAEPVASNAVTERVPRAPNGASDNAAPTWLAATASVAANARSAEAAPVQAHLATPVESPAFAPALATQVRWLIDGGVQHARLTLNPAEMGPVAVHIALEGAQARIDFSAEVAGTRNAIESSLPTLAAALSANGLTLTGGGVFDGSPQRQPGPPNPRGTPRSERADSAIERALDGATARAMRHGSVPRGLVDLVA